MTLRSRLANILALGAIASWIVSPAVAEGDGLSNQVSPYATNDVYFGSGRPWVDIKSCGAVGNLSHDDTVNVQTCVTLAANLLATGFGGRVYAPTGQYCIKSLVNPHTGIVFPSGTGGVVFEGAAAGNTSFWACGADTPIFTLNGGFAALLDVQIFGTGQAGFTPVGGYSGFGATYSTVVIASGCGACRLGRVYIHGGLHALEHHGNDNRFDIVLATGSYGSAAMYVQGGSGWYDHISADQTFVTGSSPPGASNGWNASPTAWAATTAYNAGDIRSAVGPNAQTYRIQITNTGAGTSGSVQPIVANYNVAMPDGTATWKLLGPIGYSGIQIDSGSVENYFFGTDISGAFDYGLSMTNTLGTAAPGYVKLQQGEPSQVATAAVYAAFGNTLWVGESNVAGSGTGAYGVLFGSGWTGNATITNNQLLGPTGLAVAAGSGGSIIAIGNHFCANTTAAFTIGANVSHVTIADSSAPTTVIGGCAASSNSTIAGGTGDYLHIHDNDLNGGSITNGATGTHNSIHDNM